MRTITRKYKGFSLIELLLTMMILTVIMMLVATTLNTVIKVSNTTNSKNTARGDISYLMDYMSRALTNAELADIYMYKSDGLRYLGPGGNGQLSVITANPAAVSGVYDDGELGDVPIAEGTEIHIKLYGYDDWTCIGFFWDSISNPQYGYIVRTVYEGDMGEDHSLCFDSTAVVTPLHSFMVDASDFNIEYVVVGDGENRMFLVDATLVPLYWPVKDTFPVTRAVSRQAVVATQALTWY